MPRPLSLHAMRCTSLFVLPVPKYPYIRVQSFPKKKKKKKKESVNCLYALRNSHPPGSSRDSAKEENDSREVPQQFIQYFALARKRLEHQIVVIGAWVWEQGTLFYLPSAVKRKRPPSILHSVRTRPAGIQARHQGNEKKCRGQELQV